MAYCKFLAFAFVLLFCNSFSKGDDQCPFNKEFCICAASNPPQPNVYDSVKCTNLIDPSFPTFSAPSGTTYKIIKSFSVTTSLRAGGLRAPIDFSIFTSIGDLSLSNMNKEFPDVYWVDNALASTIVTSIAIDGLANALPLPRLQDSSKLTKIRISKSGSVRLTNDDFTNLGSLSTLDIRETKISQLDDNAFTPIKDSLTQLTMQAASLTSIKALNLLNKLEGFVSLSDNSFTDIDLSQFPHVGRGENGAAFFLDNSNLLKNLKVSDPSKISSQIHFDFGGSAIETIDNKLEQVFRQNKDVIVDLSNCQKIKCDGLEWMKDYWPGVLFIDGTFCADKGVSLKDYLDSIAASTQSAATSTTEKSSAPIMSVNAIFVAVCTVFITLFVPRY